MTRVLTTIVAVEKKQLSHTVFAYVALVTQRAMRVLLIAMCGPLCSAIVFHIISIKRTIFGKKS